MSELRICLFNPNHYIKPLKYIKHLNQCQNNPGIPLVICPYDHYHIVREDRLNHHKTKCNKRPMDSESVEDDIMAYIQANKEQYNKEVQVNIVPSVSSIPQKSNNKKKNKYNQKKIIGLGNSNNQVYSGWKESPKKVFNEDSESVFNPKSISSDTNQDFWNSHSICSNLIDDRNQELSISSESWNASDIEESLALEKYDPNEEEEIVPTNKNFISKKN